MKHVKKKNRYLIHSERKKEVERILYNCRKEMSDNPEWNNRNENGGCEDYKKLIEYTKKIKECKHDGVEEFSLECKLWDPCMNALVKVAKIYGFFINLTALPDIIIFNKKNKI